MVDRVLVLTRAAHGAASIGGWRGKGCDAVALVAECESTTGCLSGQRLELSCGACGADGLSRGVRVRPHRARDTHSCALPLNRDASSIAIGTRAIIQRARNGRLSRARAASGHRNAFHLPILILVLPAWKAYLTGGNATAEGLVCAGRTNGTSPIRSSGGNLRLSRTGRTACHRFTRRLIDFVLECAALNTRRAIAVRRGRRVGRNACAYGASLESLAASLTDSRLSSARPSDGSESEPGGRM